MKTEVVTEVVDKIIYVADDGEKFNTEYECARYEGRAKWIDEGKDLIEEIVFESQGEIASLVWGLGDTSNISNVRFFKWKASSEKDVLLRVIHYLAALDCCNDLTTKSLERFLPGEIVLIGSWVEYLGRENEGYVTSTIKFSVAVEVFENLLREIKSFNY